MSYESLESQIQEQKSKIQTQKEQIAQGRVIGVKAAEGLRRVHPRIKPAQYYGQVQPEIEHVRGRLVELESAERELDIAETKLSEQESLLAKRKAEGWKLRKKGEDYEFYKDVPVSAGASAVRGDFSVRVTWMDYRTNPEGERKTVLGHASRLETMEQQIIDRGGQILEVASLGGGREHRTPEMRTTVGGGFILYEAPPIKEPAKAIKEISVYSSIYETVPAGIIKRRMPTPTKFAEARGYTIDYKAAYSMTPEIQFLLEHADPAEKAELKKAFEAGPTDAPEGFIGPIYQPIYPAFKKSFESLTPEEKTKYAEQFPVKIVTAPAVPFSEMVTARYGAERLDIYAAKHAQDLGIPTLIAGVQTLTGQDPKAWGRLHEQYASNILEYTRREGESVGDYSARFAKSPQMFLNVYLPIVTLGIGYAVKPFAIGIKTITPASKIYPVTSRIAYYGTKYHKAIIIGTAGAVGGVTAYQVYKEPEAAPLIIGRTIAGFGKMYGGYHAGGKLYSTTHAKLIQESYWTGTAYEQTILESLHKKSVLSSQYKPYEFGTPAARYTAMIRPSWQKFPYVPKTPVQVRTTTLGIRDPSDPYRGFYIKKHVLSSRDFAVYETSSVTVDVAGKDYTFSTFSGDVTVKGATRRVIGFGRGRYVSDIPDDIMLSRMYGYSITDAGRPTIIRGTAMHKTYYGGAAEWTGGKIKFFTPSKESDITIGISFGRSRGMEAFDVSSVVKPSMKAKSYFGDPGGFDYRLPTKLIDDVIMPGGMPMETGFKINLKSPFDVLKVKPTRFVDAGVYDAGVISSYWKDILPAAGSVPTMANIQKMQLATISSSMQKIGTIPIIKTIQADVHISRDIQSQFTVPVSISKSLSSSISAQESISSSLTKQLQQQMQLTQQLSINALTQITPQISTTAPVTPLVPISIYHPPSTVTPTPPPPPPPHIPFIFGALPDARQDIVGKRVRGQGFDVLIKGRYIVKGKKIKEPRFIRLNKKPLSQSDAMSLGGASVDRSAAATFKIKPVDAMAQAPLIKLPSFETIRHKFYMKDDRMIEKKTYRIDTPGEVKNISALGLYSDKIRKATKKKPAAKPRARKQVDIDMFDVVVKESKVVRTSDNFGVDGSQGFDFVNNFNTEMKKLFRM